MENNDKNKLLGERIRQARKMSDMTQAQLAGSIGRKGPLISLMEKGERYPKSNDLICFSKVLGVPVRFFFGEVGIEEVVTSKFPPSIKTAENPDAKLVNNDNSVNKKTLKRQVKSVKKELKMLSSLINHIQEPYND